MSRRTQRNPWFVVVAVVSVLPALSAQTPTWSTEFHPGSFDGVVQAAAVFDDGSGRGPMLYVGGSFGWAGGKPARSLARWTGAYWEEAAGGIRGTVECMVVHDDGRGPALFVGGTFDQGGSAPLGSIGRWDGTSWDALGGGAPANGVIRNMVAGDLGTGPRLFVNGVFAHLSGVTGGTHRAWDGASWSALGSESGSSRLVVADLGSGRRLYSRTRWWDGTTWQDLPPTGLSSPAGGDSCVHDDGSGAKLWFTFSEVFGPGRRARLATWDGAAWVLSPPGPAITFDRITSVLSGAGPELLLTSRSENLLWRFAAGSWSQAARTVNSPHDIFDTPSFGLVAVGRFTSVNGVDASRVARFNGATWSPLGSGSVPNLPSSLVSQLCAVDSDGPGPALPRLFCAPVSWIGNTPAHGLVAWNGTRWQPATTDSTWFLFHPLLNHDDGSGPAIHAVGQRSAPQAGVHVVRVAGDGTISALGGTFPNTIKALHVHDDGSGPGLYAAGWFPSVYKWNGASWQAVGAIGNVNGNASSLATFGGALYVGGSFGASSVLRWNGTAWAPMPVDRTVNSMAVFDAGTGPRLYVGGFLSNAGGVAVSNIASFDGTTWSDVGGGLTGAPGATVIMLRVLDEGAGPRLFAGGFVSGAGAQAAGGAAIWDGSSWTPLHLRSSDPLNPIPYATDFAVLDEDAQGPLPQHLWLCGRFTGVDSTPSHSFARRAVGLATQSSVGTGCPGAHGSPLLLPEGGAPRLGSTHRVDLHGIPGPIAILLAGFSETVWAGGTLPQPGAPFGMPGCTLYTDAASTRLLLGPQAASASFVVPMTPSLIGATFLQQAIVPDAGANSAGLTTSNALRCTLGW